MERKIGEIFEYNGEWYQCVESKQDACTDCAFNPINGIGYNCSGSCTYKQVIFKKLEKVGGTYAHNSVIVQKYKIKTTPVIMPDEPYMYFNVINNTIEIEIKQTKEDMEEKKVRLKKEDIDFLYNKFIEITENCVVKGYNIDNVQHELEKLFLVIKDSDTKLNLKPFDLEAAKAGKPVCTRDGRKARIICFDRENEQPIVALIKNNERECIDTFFNNGHSVSKTNGATADLMMLPEKKEGWIVIHKEAIYDKETAEKIARETTADVIRIQKIEWEE